MFFFKASILLPLHWLAYCLGVLCTSFAFACCIYESEEDDIVIIRNFMKLKKTLVCFAVIASFSAMSSPMDWTGVAPVAGESDSASAAIEFVAAVPTILDGKWVTFTGESKGTLESGHFDVDVDGQFSTSKPVVLELHYYDPISAEIGDIVSFDDKLGGIAGFGGVKISKLTYQVTDFDFTANSPTTDLSNAEANIKVNNVLVKPNTSIDSSELGANPAQTSWEISNKSMATVIGHVTAGDTISAKATVTADLDFSS